jgi:alpha-tubulin suppressor-like RCC1 family protein
VACLIWAQGVGAMPRGPFPPFPESPPLCHESFDEDYFLGQTNSELTISGLGFLDESWSGYALQRTGESVAPFIVPALNSYGHTNIASDTGGALRWWVRPYWTSGASNSAAATLVEMDAVSGAESASAWSLQVSADGNSVALFTQTGGSAQKVLQAPIAWQAGASHSVVLDYGPQGTALFLDGALAAQGTGVASVPTSVGELVLGSALSGAHTAGADFEEFYSFGSWLTETSVSLYYGMTAAEAALGPVRPEEQAGWGEGNMGVEMATIHSPGNVYDPNNDTNCSPGGPFYITNVFATLLTNGTTTVSFDIFGGTNGVFYDIFSTPTLDNSLADYQWTWIGQGMTCNAYTFSNQPAGQSFYALELPAFTWTLAFDGANAYGQCNVPDGLSNAVAVAAGGYFSLALRNNGTVIAWGDNTYGQTNIPAGLSNVTSIAAGQYHGVALLANGAVTNWGSYYNVSYYSVTNYSVGTPPPLSNVVAVAAATDHNLALLSNGTVVAWGLTNAVGNYVPTNAVGVKAIGCGVENNVALLTNGTIVAWGDNTFGEDNVPAGLTNVVAIATGAEHSLALVANGTVVAWGDNSDGETNVPAGLSNVVAIAAGGGQSLALLAVGTVVAWGESSLTNIPAGMAGVKAISAGFDHNMVIESGLMDPVIFSQPTDQYAIAGGSVTFSGAGEGVAGVQYQWQFNGTNVTGATNATLTLTNVGAANDGGYQVVVSTDAASITSSVATFTLVLPPQIVSTTPSASGPTWINYPTILSVAASAAGLSEYPLSYGWQLNGTNLGDNSANYTIQWYLPYTPTNDGTFSVAITNVAGSTNTTWTEFEALPGMVEAWGSDNSGECNRPVTLTNATGIAAGEYQSVVVTYSGTIAQWGQYWNGTNYYSVTNSSVATLPPTSSNLVAVAAGIDHAIGLTTSNTVVTWGLTNSDANYVPTNLYLTNISAIGCGWAFNVALRTNGTVIAWGNDLFNQTNVPAGLSNVVAIAAGAQHTLALLSNGTVQAWGDGFDGDTNIPAGLSNVVAIAAGESHNLALKTNGTVVAWGLNNYGQTNVPTGLSNVMAVAAGDTHSVALLNNGTLVEWGNNSSGQATVPTEQPTTVITAYGGGGSNPTYVTNTYPPIVVKLIAAGGDHTMAAIFSPFVQYPIDVSKDLLLIYNATNISFSSNICAYYMAHRPMVSNANVLGISCETNEGIQLTNYINTFSAPIVNWLLANPTKRPQYVILFQDLPSRLTNAAGTTCSVQYDMHNSVNAILQPTNYPPSWNPFVTSINMNGIGGTNDCIAYINKLANMASNNPPGTLFISASKGGYGNTNWYFDDAESSDDFGALAAAGVSNAEPSASIFTTFEPSFTTNATNVAGYYTCGWNCNTNTGFAFATNGAVKFFVNSGWYIMGTLDSFNGQRVPVLNAYESSFLTWFASNAFGGSNYSNTPVGAITHVDEPTTGGEENRYYYYGDWALGTSFGITAWDALVNNPDGNFRECAVVGDPFTIK